MKFLIFNNLFRLLSFDKSKASVTRLTIFAAILTVAATIGQAASPGALDLSFGNRGTAASTPPTNNFLEERAIVVQPDGKIVLTGFVRTCVGATCSYDLVTVRFNANGSLDNNFGVNGSVVTDFFGQNESGNAVALQADGKIVVVGSALGYGTGEVIGFKLVRYMPNGTLDTSFDGDGRAYEAFDDVGGFAQSVLVQPDGKIVVAGTDLNSMLFVARFNQNGSLDTTFGASGKIASNAYDIYLTKLALQADGKIVVAAAASPFGTLRVVRFNANGTPDNTFGSGGVATSNFLDAFTPSVAVQTDGKILASGNYVNSDRRTPPLIRFNTDGSVDTGFVPNHGEIINNGACRNCTQRPVKILLLPDGRFYLAGFISGSNNAPLFLSVSRYLSNGTIDSSFGLRGTSKFRHTNAPADINSILWRVNDAALQADGKVVIAATGNLPTNVNSETNLLAIRLNATVTPPSVRGDFDGDLKTDFAVFRPSNRFWYVMNSSDSSFSGTRYGIDGDVLTPGDYNYDRKTDFSVYRPSAASWIISSSLPSGGGASGGVFGQSGDISMPEDFDGDGYTDIALFRPSNGTWYIRYLPLSSDPLIPLDGATVQFGSNGDRPVAADYDGDGRADIAVFRPSSGYWYILRSSDGVVTATQFGIATDKTVQGDYDGDLKTDIAVFRDGNWYILRSSDNGFVAVQFGISTDKPVPGDYDGDGKNDVAVFRPNEGFWYVLKSSDAAITGQQFGISEDTPIPFTLVR